MWSRVRLFFVMLFFVLSVGMVDAQQLGIKTNALYWATSTPNVGVELFLAPQYTVSVVVGYNAFDFPNRQTAAGVRLNPKLHHWLVMPEAKYWFCCTFERHFVGLHALYGRYNVGGLRFPSALEKYRYEGWAVGVGGSYGYQWFLGRRWGLEASMGVGYVCLRYDKYAAGACGEFSGRYDRHYFGPTKAAVSFIYYIR